MCNANWLFELDPLQPEHSDQVRLYQASNIFDPVSPAHPGMDEGDRVRTRLSFAGQEHLCLRGQGVASQDGTRRTRLRTAYLARSEQIRTHHPHKLSLQDRRSQRPSMRGIMNDTRNSRRKNLRSHCD
jgi:hypothetical protein